MAMQKYTTAEKVAPVTPAQNETANTVRAAGGQPKLASMAPPECQSPGACASPRCSC